MKKLKLKLANTAEPLTKGQMKKIFGGSQYCQIHCCNAYGEVGVVYWGSCPAEEEQNTACHGQYGTVFGSEVWLCDSTFIAGPSCNCTTY